MNFRRYNEARQLFVIAWQLANDFSKQLCEEIIEHFTDLCFKSKDYSHNLEKLVYSNKSSSGNAEKVCDLFY